MQALQYAVTSVTHHLPSFIRIPAESLVGPKCYRSLVYNFDLSDSECLKHALSKGLGLGIVLGGAIVKVPQILKIVSSKSARGLSLPAFALDALACGFALAYAARNHFPFSTYGENFFLTVQNVIITLLIVWYAAGHTAAKPLSGIGGNMRASGNVRGVVLGLTVTAAITVWLSSPRFSSLKTLSFLQASTVPIAVFAKAPQILANQRAQSTGNLSAFAVFNALAGCLARLFTTSQETGDSLMWWGFALAALLNGVLAVQMVLFWNNADVPSTTPGKPVLPSEKRPASPAAYGQGSRGRKVE